MKNSRFVPFCALIAVLGLLAGGTARAQDDLLKELDAQPPTADTRPYALATFKSTRLINGHSTEMRHAKTLEVIISHRFGALNTGSYNLWGLDNAYIRIGLDYALTDNLNVGLGRSSVNKVFDGFAKYRLLRQREGGAPVSMVLFGSAAVQTQKTFALAGELPLNDRLYYVSQLLIARKFSPAFSLQLMPTVVHRNYVDSPLAANTVLALGVAGRYKISKRTAINVEYYPQLTTRRPGFYNSFAIGFDIETGGHVFQFHLTNSTGMNEKAFVAETASNFFDGAIHLGFNISRTFDLGKRRR